MVLSNGFVRGASGFLKAGGSELLKMGSASREVRVGITQASHSRHCYMYTHWLKVVGEKIILDKCPNPD